MTGKSKHLWNIHNVVDLRVLVNYIIFQWLNSFEIANIIKLAYHKGNRKILIFNLENERNSAC